jgi:tetratricopeptide (TPR) repeat protein
MLTQKENEVKLSLSSIENRYSIIQLFFLTYSWIIELVVPWISGFRIYHKNTVFRLGLILLITSSSEIHAVMPQVSNLPDKNLNLVNRDNELSQLESLLKSNAYAATIGMAGMGKTQLARLYAYNHSSQYDVIWWFDAKKNMLDQMVLLIQKFNQEKIEKPLDTHAVNFKILYKRFYSTIQSLGGKALFIFDNVEGYFDLNPFLSLNDNVTQSPVHILLTSRVDSGYKSLLKLSNFSHQESLAFLKNLLPRREISEIELLAKELNHYPLSLGQSAMYLRHHSFITVKEYLSLYNMKRQKLWQSEEKFFQTEKVPGWDENHESVSATLQLSIQEIEKHSKIVEDFLIFLSLIGSQHISSSLIKSWQITNRYDEFSFGESLSNIIKYNLVSSHHLANAEKPFFSIHDAVQKVVLSVFMKNNAREHFEKASRTILTFLLPHKNHLIKFYGKNVALTGHMETLIQKAETFKVITPSLTTLKVFLLDYYLYVKRDHKMALSIVKQIDKATHHLESEPNVYARYLSSRGDVTCLHNTNNPPQFLEALKKMETMLQKLLDNPTEDVYEVVRLQNNIGQAYLLRGDPSKAEGFLLASRDKISSLQENGALVPLYYFLTWLYIDKSEFNKALETANQAILCMEDQPNTAIKFYVYNFKALCLLSLNRYKEALQTATLSVQSCRQYFGDYKTDTLAEALSYQAKAYLEINELQNAKSSLTESIDTYNQFYKGEFKVLDQAYAYTTLGEVYEQEGSLLKAYDSYLTAFKVFKVCSEKMQTVLAGKIIYKLSLTAARLGEPSLAKKYYNLHVSYFNTDKTRELFNNLLQLSISIT